MNLDREDPDPITCDHRWVYTGAPEDDEPWCSRCGIPMPFPPTPAPDEHLEATYDDQYEAF